MQRVDEKKSQFLVLRHPAGKARKLGYLNIPSFRTGNQTGCVGVQNVTFFLSEP